MCYSHKCKYQDWNGVCTLYNDEYPKDATCIIQKEEQEHFNSESELQKEEE